MIASYGGKLDYLIKEYNLISARIVYHPLHAEELNLEIDHDDSIAVENDRNFALLLHGTHPKNSTPTKALSRMRQEKIQFSYPRQ